MIWNEEADQRMLDMVKNNCSASQVGAALGATRNAVLGRAYRLGIRFGLKGFWETNLLNRLQELYLARVPRKELAAEFNTTEKAVSDALKRLHRKGLEYRPRPNGRLPARLRGGTRIRRVEPAPEAFGRVTFQQLTSWHCHYPFGDVPDMTFCGAMALPDRPYCAEHWRATHAGPAIHSD